jgi:hypothetical protein
MKIPESVTTAFTSVKKAVTDGAQSAIKVVADNPKVSIPAAIIAAGFIGAGAQKLISDKFQKQ